MRRDVGGVRGGAREDDFLVHLWALIPTPTHASHFSANKLPLTMTVHSLLHVIVKS